MKILRNNLRIAPTKEFFLLQSLRSFSSAAFSLFPPIYFSMIGLGHATTSFIQLGMIFLVFIVSLFLANLIERFDENKIFFYALLVTSLVYLSFIFTDKIFIFILLLVSLRVLEKISTNVNSVLFRDINTSKNFTKNRSLLSIVENISWLIGPILFGIILKNYGQNGLLYSCFGLSLVCFIVLFVYPIKTKNKERESIDTNVLVNIRSFFKNKGLYESYLFRLSLKIWYSVQYFFIPYFMIEKGFAENHVGWFLGLAAIPLLITQAKIPYFRKKFGLRKIFFSAHLLLSIIAISSFIFHEQFIIILGLFLIGGFAFGFLETLPEVHFFESLKSELDEEKYISIYSSAENLGDLISKALTGILFIFLPFKYIFIPLLISALLMVKTSTNMKT